MAYFLHQVDRWPHNGSYGGDYLFLDGEHYLITGCNNRTFSCQNRKDITVVGEPDVAMFKYVMGRPWDEMYKHVYAGDENFTDYRPHYYKTYQDFVDRSSTSYKGS